MKQKYKRKLYLLIANRCHRLRYRLQTDSLSIYPLIDEAFYVRSIRLHNEPRWQNGSTEA